MSPDIRGVTPDEEESMRGTLRLIAACVFLSLAAIIVIVAVITPLVSDSPQDSGVIVGLAGAVIGAVGVMLNIPHPLHRKGENE